MLLVVMRGDREQHGRRSSRSITMLLLVMLVLNLALNYQRRFVPLEEPHLALNKCLEFQG